MKNISAGGKVTQSSDAPSTDQKMENVETPDDVSQRIATKQEEHSLALRGFGKAKGKWAVIVIGVLFAAFLLWKYLGTN